jgi:D-lactate dehydrogenase
MRIFVYSAKQFEIPYLKRANLLHFDLDFTEKSLGVYTTSLSKGYDCVCVFTNDDVSAQVLRDLKSFGVKYIAARSAGYDNIDLLEAQILEMQVANVPDYSPYAVAEHAVALILALNRKLMIANEQVHDHNFTLGNLVGFDLHEKTVGLIGTGRIGSVMARIMHGFGCEILAYDIHPSNELSKKYNVRFCSLNEICLRSDIISIHTPLNQLTKHLLNEDKFSIMKKGVMIINTARGAVVDTVDLVKYLNIGIIGAYGADVYENERGLFFFDHSAKGVNDNMLKDLLARKNVMITPHQAFATYEALVNIAETTFYNILEWAAGAIPDNQLNRKSSVITYVK